MKDEAETILFESAESFNFWLEKNYELTAGVWMKMAKKDSGVTSISSDEAVDIGLCWGWISGQRKSLDNTFYLQKYVPRRPRSMWSQVNVNKVAMLIKAGKMKAPGLAEVEAAKADGRWQAAYASQKNITVPSDLQAALDASKSAREKFNRLNKSEQYQVIFNIIKKSSPEARERRLHKTIVDLTK